MTGCVPEEPASGRTLGAFAREHGVERVAGGHGRRPCATRRRGGGESAGLPCRRATERWAGAPGIRHRRRSKTSAEERQRQLSLTRGAMLAQASDDATAERLRLPVAGLAPPRAERGGCGAFFLRVDSSLVSCWVAPVPGCCVRDSRTHPWGKRGGRPVRVAHRVRSQFPAITPMAGSARPRDLPPGHARPRGHGAPRVSLAGCPSRRCAPRGRPGRAASPPGPRSSLPVPAPHRIGPVPGRVAQPVARLLAGQIPVVVRDGAGRRCGGVGRTPRRPDRSPLFAGGGRYAGPAFVATSKALRAAAWSSSLVSS